MVKWNFRFAEAQIKNAQKSGLTISETPFFSIFPFSIFCIFGLTPYTSSRVFLKKVYK